MRFVRTCSYDEENRENGGGGRGRTHIILLEQLPQTKYTHMQPSQKIDQYIADSDGLSCADLVRMHMHVCMRRKSE